MNRVRISHDFLSSLQANAENVRNICILAHVDHGKTTLADYLVASNGIISQKMAGKLRYLDSRKDEQERGITMKSSAVALHFEQDNHNYLVNLIDSPGHVDFTSEVSTAVRLCDGALIVVDVIEGICAQTKVALKLAWIERVKPVLVLNKIDRLILEKKMDPIDAYRHLQQVLEQVNAVTGELFTTELMERASLQLNSKKDVETDSSSTFGNWDVGLDDADDSALYFDPSIGNVIFASAIDGWAFSIETFAAIWSKKLGASKSILEKTLWGEYYINLKAKRICSLNCEKARTKVRTPLFVQLVLEPLWNVYDNVFVRRDDASIEKICKSQDIVLPPRELRHSDYRIKLQSICGAWLPLWKAFINMILQHIPPPTKLSSEKIATLMQPLSQDHRRYPEETKKIKEHFERCSPLDDAPVIILVSKMFPVEKKLLPQNRPQMLTPEELAARREEARRRHAERMEQMSRGENLEINGTQMTNDQDTSAAEVESEKDSIALIAFARVFSGVARSGAKLYILGPKHDPSVFANNSYEIDESLTLMDLQKDRHITVTTLDKLYLLLGRELVEVNQVPAGNILGIGGLSEHVLRTAVISSTPYCPPFVDLVTPVVPILRVALEPATISDMPKLMAGIKLLNQADPCVQTFIQDTGEIVLVTAGEMHLDRCINDLQERFAGCVVKHSSPIVSFRETVVEPPPPPDEEDLEDMMEENRITINHTYGVECVGSVEYSVSDTVITAKTEFFTISICAKPLPESVTKHIDSHSDLLKEYLVVKKNMKEYSDNDDFFKRIIVFCDELSSLFKADDEFKDVSVDSVWSFGPRRHGPNVLLNTSPDFAHQNFWPQSSHSEDFTHDMVDSHLVNGFQLATLAGPICEEPMMGVCFVVKNFKFLEKASMPEEDSGSRSAKIAGQLITTTKDTCRRAFELQPQRLMCAMYSCNIQVSQDTLGKMYDVMRSRHGKILSSDLQEGSQMFIVSAVLPVIESFGLIKELRSRTSGHANLQLFFSHWEVVEEDPYWVPSENDEGKPGENRAQKYMLDVRRRKGLSTFEPVVEHAEKQRTHKKNK